MMIIAGIAFLLLNVSLVQAQVNERIPLIGSEAPSFKANSTNGQISFPEDFGRKWKIVFAHPRNYTPVCSSEILELAYHHDKFKEMNAQIIVVSTDRLISHRDWKAALEEISFKGREKVEIEFPLVEDPTYAIVNSFGMLDSRADVGESIRGVFFIDPENTVRAFYFYPNEVGRSIDEMQRTLLALQANYNDARVMLPADWKPGDAVMVPYLEPEEKDANGNPDKEQGFYSESWFMNYKNVK